MDPLIVRLLEQQIGMHQDNAYRARLAMGASADPDALYGASGKSLRQIVTEYDEAAAEAQQSLAAYQERER